MKFVSDKVVALSELAVKKGQLSYLKNLAKVIALIKPSSTHCLQGSKSL